MKYLCWSLLFYCLTGLGQAPTMEQLWQQLQTPKPACLLGLQYSMEQSTKGRQTTLFASEVWESFAEYSKKEKTAFLLNKTASQKSTKVHVCPFANATEAELAVYALQRIHRTFWYDIQAFKDYKQRDYSSEENPQLWLNTILKDPGKRQHLIAYYNSKI